MHGNKVSSTENALHFLVPKKPRFFAHKRKKVTGNLKNVCGKELLAPFENKRAEDLTLLDWVYLAKT